MNTCIIQRRKQEKKVAPQSKAHPVVVLSDLQKDPGLVCMSKTLDLDGRQHGSSVVEVGRDWRRPMQLPLAC